MGKTGRLLSSCIGVACIAGGIGPAPAAGTAGDFPSKPVRMIVPQAPGGGIDFMARLVGHSVVVDNRTGAGSTIGTNIVAKSTPDGYTLAVNSISMAFNVTLYNDLPYDTLRDLVSVSMLASSPNVMTVNPSTGAKSVQEVIRRARASPGKLNYGSGGVGGSDQVCTEYFLKAAGISIVNVSYKGSAPALIDLAAGALDVAIAPIASSMALVKAGKLRALAVTTAQRSPLLPEIPTIAESGVPRFEYGTWYGVWAPSGTPRPVLTRLNEEIRKAVFSADVRERMASQGAEPAWRSVDDFNAFFRAEVARWAPIIRNFSQPAQ
jgi:tripartite-type tricarboxylate transporter receptor subunit TctC